MALDFQVAPVSFTQGLDTKSQRKMVVPGKWDTLVNVSLSDNWTLKRRDGFEALNAGLQGNGLATRNDELVATYENLMMRITEAGQAITVEGEVPMIGIDKSEVVASEVSCDQQDMACDSANEVACYVWRERETGSGTTSGIKMTVVNLNAGTRVVVNRTLRASATATSPRVVFDDGAFFIFYIDGTSLYCTVIVSGTATVGTETTLLTLANLSSKNFDACAKEFETGVVVAFMAVAPEVNSVQAISVTRSGTTPSAGANTLILTAANVTEASICGIAVRSFGTVISPGRIGFFVLHTAGGALAAGLIGVVTNTGFAVASGPANISATVPPVNGPCHVTAVSVIPAGGSTVMQVFFDQQSSWGTANIRPLQSVVVTSLLAVNVDRLILRSASFVVPVVAGPAGPHGPYIAGKAFAAGSRTFLPVMVLENYNRPSSGVGSNTDTVSAQCSFWVFDTTSALETASDPCFLAGGALYGTLGLLDATLGGNSPTVSTPCSTPQIAGLTSSTVLTPSYGICLQERGRLNLTNGINLTPVGLSLVSMSPQRFLPQITSQLGEWMFMEGGVLGNYDGQQILQNGFPMYPEGINPTRINTGGAANKLTVGVHQIVAVYEWTDGAGNRHQSAPSLPVSVTVVLDTDTIDVLVPTTQIPVNAGYSSNISTLSIVCYMTAAGGITFYRAPEAIVPTRNDVTATTVTVTIGAFAIPDAVLTRNELLYTQPNQAGTTLPNITSGPLHGIGVSQSRLWGWISDEPGEFTYSQEVRQNTGLQFNPDTLTGRVPTTAGRGVAIAPLDEKTILFCERALYVVFGTGPTTSGGFNNFSDPLLIPSDVGCSESRSVIAIPDGLLFKSQKGWYLLGRDMSVQYAGDGVARYDANNVTSAVMLEDEQEVRFSSLNGPQLVYSYRSKGPDGIGQWSVYNLGNWDAIDTDAGKVIDAAWWSAAGRYIHLHSSSTVYPGLMRDTPGQFLDGVGSGAATTGAIITARTGFLHVSELESFQRVRRMYLTATADNSPTTTLTIRVDFDDIYTGNSGSAPGTYTASQDLSLVTWDSLEAIDLRHHLARQKCKSVAFTFTEGAGDNETKVPLSGLQALALEIGRKRGVNKLPAAQTFG